MRVKMKSNRSFWIPIIALAGSMILSAQALDLADLGSGVLTVRAVDPYGGTVSSLDVAVYSLSDAKRTRVIWQPGKELPFGTYVIEVSASGFARFSETIRLRSKRLEILACLQVGSVDEGSKPGPPSRIVLPRPDGNCTLVLIQPMFCPSSRTPLLSYSHQGAFTVEGLQAGRYVGFNVSPDKYCGSVAFDVTMAGSKIVATPEVPAK